MRKVYLLFFKTFLVVLTKLSFWQGEWVLGYHFMKFRHFPNISFLRSYVVSRSTPRDATRIYHVYS